MFLGAKHLNLNAQFCRADKARLKDDFWLRLKTIKITRYQQSLRNAVVSCYHPIIMKFLQKKIVSLQQSTISDESVFVNKVCKALARPLLGDFVSKPTQQPNS